MAEIEQPYALSAVRWRQQKGRGFEGGGGYGSRRAKGRSFSAEDMAKIVGVSPETLSPAVWEVVRHLVEEREILREDIEAARRRQTFLEELVESHPVLPILNRRAWIRAVEDFLTLRERVGLGGVAGCYYLLNYEELHGRFGLEAAEAALLHLARQLAGAVRATDKVGHGGGSGVVVLMCPAEAPGAERKMSALARVIGGRLVHRQGVPLALRLGLATRPVGDGDTAAKLLEDLDASIRRDNGEWGQDKEDKGRYKG